MLLGKQEETTERNSMIKSQFWDTWLFVVAILIVVFGIFLAFFNQSAFFDFLFNNQINPVFWPGLPPNDARLFQTWSYAVLGATVAGWGVFIAFIARYPFRRRDPWAFNCLAGGLGLWYGLDSGLSLYYGVWFNALFNTLLLIAAALPLFFTAREFRHANPRH